MKSKFFLTAVSVVFLLSTVTYAKEEMPDPLYRTSDTLDYTQVESEPVKEKDVRTLNEKFREKFHLPPTKKIYYHNIDMSNAPVTVDDYYKLAAEKKRKDFEIPLPEFLQDGDVILPDPHYRVIKYNTPPGQRNIDLTQLIARRTVSSPGILSPDKKKMVYTKCFYYPKNAQTSSAAYFINVNPQITDAYEVLYRTNVMEGDTAPIFTVGMNEVQKYQYKTLYPLDWSQDSTKIAFKEKIGSNLHETWQTNVIIYDFKTQTYKRLIAVREAIVYWWRQNKQIELKDYMWDIYPIGWDKNNPDNIVVYAYAFTNDKPLFLGTWSVDFNEDKSSLISIDSTYVQIDLNGFGLKEVKMEH